MQSRAYQKQNALRAKYEKFLNCQKLSIQQELRSPHENAEGPFAKKPLVLYSAEHIACLGQSTLQKAARRTETFEAKMSS